MDFKQTNRVTGIAPDCHLCILNQARATSRVAGLSEEQTRRIIGVAQLWLEKSKTTPLLVQHVIRHVEDAIIQEKNESPAFDIYSKIKKNANALSLAYAKKLQKKIDNSDSPFEMGLQIAAAGNIIDFGAKNHGAIDLDQELRSLTQIPFGRYDINRFKQTLAHAGTLLYICDNSGEIVFDMVFIREIKKCYPGIEIVAAVRDQPIINDATMEDAETVGLNRLVTTISSGSVYPGTILSEATEEFKTLFAAADVILSKGQGNFETLLPLADQRIFFLLRIKCEYMASISNVEKDTLVLMQPGG
jgi:uncharacterized protein with ATP-grasp and redox domains